MANSEKLRRRKATGEKAMDPTAVQYGAANPYAPKPTVPTDPRTAAGFNPQVASMDGRSQNPYGDASAQLPQMGAPGGSVGGVAPFSGAIQFNVPGTGYNRMPGNMIPSFSQAGSAPDTDLSESQRIGMDIQNRANLYGAGSFTNAMGLANPGYPNSVTPGGSQPANLQTPFTMPLQGVTGGLPQGGEKGQGKRAKRGGRNSGGMTT
jgi:hypothetical protein